MAICLRHLMMKQVTLGITLTLSLFNDKHGIEKMIGRPHRNNMAYEDKLTDEEIVAALSFI